MCIPSSHHNNGNPSPWGAGLTDIITRRILSINENIAPPREAGMMIKKNVGRNVLTKKVEVSEKA